ncbi:MAG: radical SAM family heme chaperone HemW [Acidobacteria bacterium]|nr:radical SAM family heme chaperone HemW [Acidobacteriota bacterium]
MGREDGGAVAGERPGIYVHIPFCRRKCAYCGFLTCPPRGLVQPYLAALGREIAGGGGRCRSDWGAPDTLYFGGGSPSLVAPEAVAALIEAVTRAMPPAPGAEVSLEANPEDVDPARAARWVEAGVNRVTLGVQSFRSATLEPLGRAASPGRIGGAVKALRGAGCANLGADLIAGLPGENLADWRHSLSATLGLGIDHLSLYLLETEPQTPLGRGVAAATVVLPPDDVVGDFYLEACETLAAAGLAQYEISNFSRPGFESRHNRKYWDFSPYLGFGCGAHSFDGSRRTHNAASVRAYVEAVEAGGGTLEEENAGTARDREREWVFLGLRRVSGIRLSAFEDRFGRPFPAAWRESFAASPPGLAEFTRDTLRLSRRGMLLSNALFLGVFDSDAEATGPPQGRPGRSEDGAARPAGRRRETGP